MTYLLAMNWLQISLGISIQPDLAGPGTKVSLSQALKKKTLAEAQVIMFWILHVQLICLASDWLQLSELKISSAAYTNCSFLSFILWVN